MIYTRAPHCPAAHPRRAQVYTETGVCPVPMTIRLSHAFAIVALCLLTACGTLGDLTITKRSAIDREIATARAETQSHLTALNDQQVALLHQSVAAHEAREQGAADYLFKGLVTSASLKTPTRHEMVMGQSIEQTATQLPPATAAAQAKALQDLKTELDETRISADTLRAQYESELGKARAEGAVKEKALTDLGASLKRVDEERITVLAKATKTEADLSDKRAALDAVALAAKTKEAEDAKSLQAIKLRFSAITGALTLLCIAGAIYSPVFKRQLGIGAVALSVVTAAIWYVQPWMVGVAIGVTLVGLAAWMVKNHYIESKTASNVYHALQSIKDTAGDDYDRVVKPKLAEWMTTYTKDGKTVPDAAAVAHVDSVLMHTGAL